LEAVHASVAAAQCRELAAVHRLEVRACAHEGSSCGRESLSAEVFEGVVAAFEQLAREREAAAVAPEPSGCLQEVVTVRGTLAAGGLGGLI
jgi:hypothetical protein